MLGLVTVPDARRGIEAARAVLRITGRGHSASIHSQDPATIMEYGAAVEVLRVSVNVGNSLGSAGLETGLAPTMTIGTGFFGRSSVGENLHPGHLVQWTRLAYNSDPAEPFGDFTGLSPWAAPATASVAPCRRTRSRPTSASTAPDQPQAGPHPRPKRFPLTRRLRDEIRRMVIEELAQLTGRPGGEPVMAELRSFIFLSRLQPQTMCYLGTWIRGSLPRSHVAAQVIEVAPGLDIEPLTDVAVKHADVRAGILVVERQFGYLEIHGGTDEVQAAASAVLGTLGATARDARRPEILASKIITMLDPQQAFLVNRNKIGSMALAGESLFVLEMQPASYAILAANEAEKAARVKLVDYRMIGATGRLYLSGTESDVRQAAEAAEDALPSRLMSSDLDALRALVREVIRDVLPNGLRTRCPRPSGYRNG